MTTTSTETQHTTGPASHNSPQGKKPSWIVRQFDKDHRQFTYRNIWGGSVGLVLTIILFVVATQRQGSMSSAYGNRQDVHAQAAVAALGSFYGWAALFVTIGAIALIIWSLWHDLAKLHQLSDDEPGPARDAEQKQYKRHLIVTAIFIVSTVILGLFLGSIFEGLGSVLGALPSWANALLALVGIFMLVRFVVFRIGTPSPVNEALIAQREEANKAQADLAAKEAAQGVGTGKLAIAMGVRDDRKAELDKLELGTPRMIEGKQVVIDDKPVFDGGKSDLEEALAKATAAAESSSVPEYIPMESARQQRDLLKSKVEELTAAVKDATSPEGSSKLTPAEKAKRTKIVKDLQAELTEATEALEKAEVKYVEKVGLFDSSEAGIAKATAVRELGDRVAQIADKQKELATAEAVVTTNREDLNQYGPMVEAATTHHDEIHGELPELKSKSKKDDIGWILGTLGRAAIIVLLLSGWSGYMVALYHQIAGS
jgi:hypothetical protein